MSLSPSLKDKPPIPKQLFIADLHLDHRAPDTYHLALQFLKKAKDYDQLYILGDVFEYWLGDDMGLSQHEGFINGLRALNGFCPVNVMVGNRDFLLSTEFAHAAQVRLNRDDQWLIDLGGKSVLLMHGDTLCTEDHDYQQFRQTVRHAEWQATFLKHPPEERIAAAEAMRSASKKAGTTKQAAIMDVHQPTVDSTMESFGVQTLIHGHTHRPAHHKYPDKGTERWVVGDWHKDHAQYVEWDGQQLQLKTFTADC